VRSWAGQWMALWDAVPHCKYWAACLLALYGRLAKHDVSRCIDWEALLPQLLTKILHAIEIPVGGTMASSPISRRPPRECLMLFSVECLPRARSSAKLIVYLLSSTGSGASICASPSA